MALAIMLVTTQAGLLFLNVKVEDTDVITE